jgi:biopolymer transport protein ExbB
VIEQLKNAIVLFGAGWVLWLLAGISVLSIGVMLERLFVFWSKRDDIAGLVADLGALLQKSDLAGAHTRLALSASVEAAIALAGLGQWQAGGAAVQEALAARLGLERSRLERRLLILGTIGNNAPFVGLLGTVIGVVGAFDELGRTGVAAGLAATQLAPTRVMSTIAEALVATAAGLVVAIPAVAAFNYFQGLVAARSTNAETLGHVVLTHVNRLASKEM